MLASFFASKAARAQSADLAVTKSPVGGSPVTAGTDLTWAIGVENAGPDAAQTVSMVDTGGQGPFVSLTSPPGWSCTTPAVGGSPAVVSCSIASLPIGNYAFFLTVHVNPDTPPGCCLTNSAIVDSTTPDPDDVDKLAMSAVAVAAPAAAVPALEYRGLLALILVLAAIGALTLRRS